MAYSGPWYGPGWKLKQAAHDRVRGRPWERGTCPQELLLPPLHTNPKTGEQHGVDVTQVTMRPSPQRGFLTWCVIGLGALCSAVQRIASHRLCCAVLC